MINVSLITPDSGDACSIYRGVGPYMRLPVNLQTYDGNLMTCNRTMHFGTRQQREKSNTPAKLSPAR